MRRIGRMAAAGVLPLAPPSPLAGEGSGVRGAGAAAAGLLLAAWVLSGLALAAEATAKPKATPAASPAASPKAPTPAEAAAAARARHAAALEKVGKLKDEVQTWTKDPGAKERLRAAQEIREALQEARASASRALPGFPIETRSLYGKLLDVLVQGFQETELFLEREARGLAPSRGRIAQALDRMQDRLGGLEEGREAFRVREEMVRALYGECGPALGLPTRALLRPTAPLVRWSPGRAHGASILRLAEALPGMVELALDAEEPPSLDFARGLEAETAAALAEALRTAGAVGLAPAETELQKGRLEALAADARAMARAVRLAAEQGRKLEDEALETEKLPGGSEAFAEAHEAALDALDEHLEAAGALEFDEEEAEVPSLFGLPVTVPDPAPGEPGDGDEDAADRVFGNEGADGEDAGDGDEKPGDAAPPNPTEPAENPF